MLSSSDMSDLYACLPALKNMRDADRDAVIAAGSRSSFAQGDIIMSREKECSGLVVVKSGQLRAFIELENGKEITLYRLLSGDICILTASCVLKNINFEVTLEVEKDGEVYFIPALTWKKLTEQNSSVKEFSADLVAERFSDVMWVMEQMVTKNMGQRIAGFLLEQSVLEESKTLAVTHDTIAKNLGTAREVISRSLKYLENDGLLRLSRGEIQLTDTKRLEEMSR